MSTEQTDGPRILALCAGYGGLELAVSSLIGGTVVAFAENDPHAAAVFSSHHPGAPNLGDISAVDWAAVLERYRPDVITAGWPCRNISNAGDRSGIDGQWSKVWKHVAEAVGVLRPRLVLMENVAALTRRGLPRVLGDLAGHGYDARWTCVRASETVGACHPRYRWFGLAHPVSDPDVGGWHRGAGNVAEQDGRGEPAYCGDETADPRWVTPDGKDYGPAVRRWERVTGRPAPCSTEPGTRGNRRLSPAFEEWMMGLPDGWVTAVPDIPRREQMRIIGNGVVWQQGRHAFNYLMTSDDFTITKEGQMDDTEGKTEKPRGKCTGCPFDYQLGTARSGEYKGQLVIRKHNSRTGPGLCDGAQKPPKGAETEEPVTTDLGDSDAAGPGVPQGDAFIALAAPEVADVGTVVQGLRDSRYIPAASPFPIDDLRPQPDPFTAPAPMPAELPPVHGQPEPDRDRYGRYLLHGQAHTRATTFAKSASSTHALTEWRERMTVLGLVQRRDLLALAHGMHVKRDRVALNSIVQQAKDTAGVKVAANLGTAYHAFSERLDAGLMTLDEVPQEYRRRCAEYVEAVRSHGLTTRPEWIERTTAVRADQVSALLPVAGTLDRIFRLPNGELVIGDLKTGADLSYGWGEIAVQLALYAHGCNTFGLFDWNTKTWESHTAQVAGDVSLKVRTDYGIVMHLPADGTGCTLYRIDLVKGWERAQVCGQVMTMQKSKDGLAMELTAGMLDATPYPPPLPKPGSPQRPPAGPVSIATDGSAVLQTAAGAVADTLGDAAQAQMEWDHAVSVFSAATTQDELAVLYQYAMNSGLFTDQQLGTLAAIGAERLAALAPA